MVKAEVKYSIEPADPSLADQIQVNTMLVAQHESQNAEGKYQTTFCQKAVPNGARIRGSPHRHLLHGRRTGADPRLCGRELSGSRGPLSF